MEGVDTRFNPIGLFALELFGLLQRLKSAQDLRIDLCGKVAKNWYSRA